MGNDGVFMSDAISVTERESILEFILQELVFLSNAQDIQDKKISVSKMLEAIQLYTNADRVYVFETIGSGECFCNTYEFCREGVTPQIYALNNVLAGDMPFWYEEFIHGKSVVIDNVEDIRRSMPHEYALLKAQDIHSVIAFPIYRAPVLYGFLGVDNPEIIKSGELINLLGLIGGFLGSISDSDKENGAFMMKQEEKPQAHVIEREKMYLEILCQEYTTVLYLDLKTGMTDVIKISPLSYMSRVLEGYGTENLDYDKVIHEFAEKYVVGNRDAFLGEMSVNNLHKRVMNNSHLAYRYETVINTNGKKYIEVQVIRLAEEEEGCGVILGYRYIDSIIRKEHEQQERLEAALSEAKLNNEIISAISKIYFLIYRIDLNHNWYDEISSNTEVHRLTGKSGNATEKMYEICNTFVTEEYQETVRRFFDLSTLRERLKDEETVAVEYKAKDGDWQLARFIVKKRDSEGNATHVLYVTRVISDTKLREQNLILIAEEANRANIAKTDFLSRVSHDIRTPLNAISGFCEIAKADRDNSCKVDECLEKIETSCNYLEEIVNDVLDLTRIEDDNILVHEDNVNLEKEFSQLLETTAIGLSKKKMHLNYVSHDIIHPYVILDSNHMKQIFTNLISNAIKYTPEGGTITFEVSETISDKPDCVKTVFCIRDTGIGMDETFMKKMYERFTRAIDTRINNVRGSGLGLAVVKELTGLLHGKIEAKSTLGKGTEFTLYFDCPMGKEEKKEGDISLQKSDYKGLHLLVAEDNQLNYEVAEGILSIYGVKCDHAVNGEECVKMLENSRPGTYQAVLMDMQMPVMSGIEATQAIRKMDSQYARNIPIIGLTANAFESDVEKCLCAGMDAHFSKPFHADRMLAKITELINAKKNVSVMCGGER